MLPFEKWLNESKSMLDSVCFDLFSDSIKCYKYDIDRPAYLLAYQGMMCHIKRIIIYGKRPDGFAEVEWQNYIRELNNDRLWDEKCYDRIRQLPNTQNGKPAVLCIPSEVRNKFDFWRDMRNVCAHYKEYDFIKAHVDVLYSFISQYLLSITIEGGMKTLVEDFKRFFNPLYTSPNEDIKPLIEKIPKMVQMKEYNDFLNLIDGIYEYWNWDDQCKLYNNIIENVTNEYKDKTYEHIAKNDLLKILYIERFPKSIHLLITEKDDIRHFCITELPKMRNVIGILSELLVGGMIEGDKNEIIKYILRNYYNQGRYIEELEQYKSILVNNGFFEIFLNEYYNKKDIVVDYKAKCYKTDFYISIIESIPINDTFVNNTLDIFSELPYPYILQDRFRNKLVTDESFRNKFNEKLSELGRELPISLQ